MEGSRRRIRRTTGQPVLEQSELARLLEQELARNRQLRSDNAALKAHNDHLKSLNDHLKLRVEALEMLHQQTKQEIHDQELKQLKELKEEIKLEMTQENKDVAAEANALDAQVGALHKEVGETKHNWAMTMQNRRRGGPAPAGPSKEKSPRRQPEP